MKPTKTTTNKTHITLYLEPNFIERLIGVKPKRITYKMQSGVYIGKDGTIYAAGSSVYNTLHKLRFNRK